MARTATLIVENREYKLLDCNYNIFKHQQENGQPESVTIDRPIQFTVKSPDDNDLFFHQWIRGSTETKDGQIVFTVFDKGEPTLKTLNFTDAYCVYLRESFNSYGEGQMFTTIAISTAKEITFGEPQKAAMQPIATYISNTEVVGVGDQVLPPLSGRREHIRNFFSPRTFAGFPVNAQGEISGPIQPITGIAPTPGAGALRAVRTVRKGNVFLRGVGNIPKEGYHKIKKSILDQAGRSNFEHIVGRNPNLAVGRDGKVILEGVEAGFRGKTFITNINSPF
jgi:hypothetical protein